MYKRKSCLQFHEFLCVNINGNKLEKKCKLEIHKVVLLFYSSELLVNYATCKHVGPYILNEDVGLPMPGKPIKQS